jgi:ATP-dependent HslUV protease subunit HslV
VTTWAYRDGVLAADRLVTWNTHRDGYISKARKNGPFLACASGDLTVAQAFFDWFMSGLPKGREPDMRPFGEEKYRTTGHIFMPDGLILCLTHIGWNHMRAPYQAGGSGCDYAFGALAMGATAEQAVRAALVHETASGGPIDVLRHTDPIRQACYSPPLADASKIRKPDVRWPL